MPQLRSSAALGTAGYPARKLRIRYGMASISQRAMAPNVFELWAGEARLRCGSFNLGWLLAGLACIGFPCAAPASQWLFPVQLFEKKERNNAFRSRF